MYLTIIYNYCTDPIYYACIVILCHEKLVNPLRNKFILYLFDISFNASYQEFSWTFNWGGGGWKSGKQGIIAHSRGETLLCCRLSSIPRGKLGLGGFSPGAFVGKSLPLTGSFYYFSTLIINRSALFLLQGQSREQRNCFLSIVPPIQEYCKFTADFIIKVENNKNTKSHWEELLWTIITLVRIYRICINLFSNVYQFLVSDNN